MSEEHRYPGKELELFRHATIWKRYWSGSIHRFIRGRVLEVGAGIGSTIPWLRDSSRTWTALEPDASLATQIPRGIDGADEIIVGDLGALPPDTLYDTILYIDVLEHIEDDAGEIASAASRLDSGGRLIVLSPSHPFLYSPFDREIGHFRRYTRKSLASLTPPELQLLYMRHYDSVGCLASAANRFLLRRTVITAREVRFWDRFIVPFSRFADPLLGRWFGKSLITVWERRPRCPI